MSKWMVKMKKADFDAIADKFGISRITARLLTNRGLSTDEEIMRYLSGDASMLHDPSELFDIEKGAEVIGSRTDTDLVSSWWMMPLQKAVIPLLPVIME